MSRVKKLFSLFVKALDNHPMICFAVLSVLENFIIECLSRHSVADALMHTIGNPMAFLYNSLIIMATLSVSLLFKRRVFGVVLLSAPWLICGLINNVVLSYRVTPLGAIDFQIVKLSLILMYLTKAQRIILYCTVGIFIVAVIALWMVGPKISGKVYYGKNTASIVGMIICVFMATNLLHNMTAIGTEFGNLVGAYDNYGFVYCFSSSMVDTGIDKPADYSEESIKAITSDLPSTNDASSRIKPDIVLIQLESFIDPKTIKDMTFSDDPAPIHTYLRENYSGGNLAVPSFGGGTANTEYEVLSGINLDNFGPGEYPYKTIMLEQTVETIAYNLKELGYSAHAIHNHTGNFYDRDKVYPRMGFDSFQSKEYMYDYETTPYGWCKDKELTEEIITALDYVDEESGIDSEHPRFVWTVSVQGHGAYPSEPVAGADNVIKIESDNFDEKELCALGYYINQVWEMDMFLGSLISALENRNRPTILIAYGDHLPAIGLEAEHLTTGTTYSTEYVTWNNFDLPMQRKDLRTYELSGEIMQWLGFNNGNLTKLYQRKNSENPISHEEYEEGIRNLAYDMLYGKNYQFGEIKPFEKTNMRMGTLPIEVENIKVMGDSLYVQGSGFTEKSKIFLNGEKLSTVMLSRYSLMASGVSVNEGDSITVGQSSSKREVLSYSDTFIYSETEHLIETPPEEEQLAD